MTPETMNSSGLELSRVEKLTSIARLCIAGPNSVRPEGEYFVAIEENGFGIPSVDTCPGRTDYCEQDCYAIESEYRTATAIKLQRNLDVLNEAGTVENMTAKLMTMVDGYTAQADKLKIPEDERRIRIHWSGDFFSTDYATSWRNTIEANPDKKFWTYTRSFQPDTNVVPILSGLDNLDLFLSVDFQNVDEAEKILDDFPDVRVGYLVDYLEDAEALIDQLGRNEGYKDLACPENMRRENGARKLPVISERGGACARCQYCIDNHDKKWDVIFVKTGLQSRAQGRLSFIDQVPVKITPRPKARHNLPQLVGSLSVNENELTLF